MKGTDPWRGNNRLKGAAAWDGEQGGTARTVGWGSTACLKDPGNAQYSRVCVSSGPGGGEVHIEISRTTFSPVHP